MTHTYAILPISASAYQEIRDKLVVAGYEDAIHESGDGERIDLTGIAVRAEEESVVAIDAWERSAQLVEAEITPTRGDLVDLTWNRACRNLAAKLRAQR